MNSFQINGLSIKISHLPISIPLHLSIRRTSSPPKSSPSLSSNPQSKCLKTKTPKIFSDISNPKTTPSSSFDLSASHLPLIVIVSHPLPCFAAVTEGMSSKINIDSVLVSIDDFFNRYPYFVASLAFIWLVGIPLTQEYLNKYKFVSSIDAFRKLRDDPSSHLLDIRKKQSVANLTTPNLKIFNKVAVNLEFVEGCEEEFIKEVLKSFRDPGSTILCVLDNFDGNSLKVAKLLFKNGFKEAYAIKGGLLGKDGWQAIQETLLPPSVHVYPKKKSRKLPDQEVLQNVGNGHMKSGKSSALSPYPNFKDLKPPSSPTPSKPSKLN